MFNKRKNIKSEDVRKDKSLTEEQKEHIFKITKAIESLGKLPKGVQVSYNPAEGLFEWKGKQKHKYILQCLAGKLQLALEREGFKIKQEEKENEHGK